MLKPTLAKTKQQNMPANGQARKLPTYLYEKIRPGRSLFGIFFETKNTVGPRGYLRILQRKFRPIVVHINVKGLKTCR